MLRINCFLKDWLLSSDTLTKNSMHCCNAESK